MSRLTCPRFFARLACALLLLVGVTVAAPSEARASGYALPSLDEFLDAHGSDLRIAVITVDHYDDARRGHYTVDRALLGEFAADGGVLEGIAYSCEHDTLDDYGLETGRPWLVVFIGDDVAVENLFFPVQPGEQVVVGAYYERWLELDGPVITIDALAAHLEDRTLDP